MRSEPSGAERANGPPRQEPAHPAGGIAVRPPPTRELEVAFSDQPALCEIPLPPSGPSPDRLSAVARSRSLEPEAAWGAVELGFAGILDLRTEIERRRYGAPPGARPVSLVRHAASPEGPGN